MSSEKVGYVASIAVLYKKLFNKNVDINDTKRQKYILLWSLSLLSICLVSSTVAQILYFDFRLLLHREMFV